jgi:P pilus assembly chaperone PapD
MDVQHRRLYGIGPVHAGRALAASAVLALLAGPGAAAAQDLLSVDVTPLRVELALRAGATHTQAVTLKNEGQRAVHVRARVDDWFLSRDGTPQFKLVEPTDPYSAAAWVRVNPPEQTVGPGATAIVRFTTTVPVGVKDGGYRCAVMFEFDPPDTDPAAKAREVRFRGRVATLLYATVGTPGAVVEMTDLQIRTAADRAPDVVATLKNAGPVHVRTTGTAAVYDASGQEVRKLTVPNVPVLPESEREVSIPTASSDQAGLPPGKYRVEVRLDVGLRELLVGETTLEVPAR